MEGDLNDVQPQGGEANDNLDSNNLPFAPIAAAPVEPAVVQESKKSFEIFKIYNLKHFINVNCYSHFNI